MGTRKRTRRSTLVMKKLLPDDVIREMLSWFPVKSLLRFKCVCKSWQLITQQTSFIEKHRSRSKYEYVYEDCHNHKEYRIDDTYKCRHYKDGLVLEENEKSDKYRIRNPATKQVIEVPEKPLKVKSEWRFILMCSNHKLMCVHYTINKLKPCFVIKTLTLGTDFAWRPVGTLSGECYIIRQFYFATYKEISYLISLCFYGSVTTQIARLNMDDQDESFMTINIPQGFEGPVNGRNDSTREEWFQAFMWDEKLSLGFIVEDHELHVWVLENYKKQQWSEKKIISLHFMKDYSNKSRRTDLNKKKKSPRTAVITASKGQLEVRVANVMLQYDIHSNKVTCLAEAPPGKQILYRLEPSLVSLRGMHSEDMPTYNKHDKVRLGKDKCMTRVS